MIYFILYITYHLQALILNGKSCDMYDAVLALAGHR